MLLWRTCKEKYLSTAFSGIGAEKVGGRWNYPGHKMVYTSQTSSLAIWEQFVHLDPDLIPNDLMMLSAMLPDDVSQEKLGPEDLPNGWSEVPGPVAALQDIGTTWLLEKRTLLLRVPSVVNPKEFNVLINPQHAEFSALSDITQEPVRFDPRVLKLFTREGPGVP